MRLRNWLPSRVRDAAPARPRGRVARPPEWPRLAPLQRAVTGPSLVTDPDGFRRGLSTWGSPLFLDAPGHLLSPGAPSGTVSGLAVSRVPSRAAVPAVGQDRGSGTPGVGSGPSTTAVQRSAAAPPSRNAFLPAQVGPAPGPPDRFLSAAGAPVPPPVSRPALPVQAAADTTSVTASPGAPVEAGPSEDVPVVHGQAVDDLPASPFEGSVAVSVPTSVPASAPAPVPADRPVAPGPATDADAWTEAPAGLAARTLTLGGPPLTVARAADHGPSAGGPSAGGPATGGPLPVQFTDAPSAAPVQRPTPERAGQPAGGRRRLGLGAPLPVPPTVESPPASLPPPRLTGPSVVRRVGAPVGPGAAVQRAAAPVGTAAGAGRVGPPPATGNAAATGHADVVQRHVDMTTEPDVDMPTAPVAETVVHDPGDVAPVLPLAGPHPERVEGSSVLTLGADSSSGDPLGARTSGPASVPGGAPRPVPAAAVVQRAVDGEYAVQRDADAAQRGRDDLPPVRRRGATSAPPAQPPQPSVAQRSGAPPVDTSPGGADAAPLAPVVEPVPAQRGLDEASGPAPAVGLPGAAAAPSLPADDPTTPLVGGAEPLPGPVRTVLGIQREVDGRSRVASPVPRPAASAAHPAAGAPSSPDAGAPTGSPVLQILAAGPARPAATAGSTPPDLPVPAAWPPSPAGGRGASGSGAAGIPSLPGSGRTVGPVGARPVQRQVAPLPAPAGSAPDARGTGVVPGGQVQVQRSVGAPAGADPAVVAAGWTPWPGPSPGRSPVPPPGAPAVGSGSAAAWPAPLPGVARTAVQGAQDGSATGRMAIQPLVPPGDVPLPAAVPAAAALVPVGAFAPGPGDAAGGLPPAPAATPEVGARSAGGAAAGPASALQPAAADVDALVRRLYDPLARRLRAELRLDRERVGRALDLRH